MRITKKTVFFILSALLCAFLFRAGAFDPFEVLCRDLFIRVQASFPDKDEFKRSPITVVDLGYSDTTTSAADITDIINIILADKPSVILLTFPADKVPDTCFKTNKIVAPAFILREREKVTVFDGGLKKKYIKNIGFMEIYEPQPIRSFISFDTYTSSYHIIVEALIKYYNSVPSVEREALSFNKDKFLSFWRRDTALINYQSKSILYSENVPFEYVDSSLIRTGKYKKSSFAGKIVILGGTKSPGNSRQTPVGFMAESEILAHGLYMVTNDKNIIPLNDYIYRYDCHHNTHFFFFWRLCCWQKVLLFTSSGFHPFIYNYSFYDSETIFCLYGIVTYYHNSFPSAPVPYHLNP